MGIQSCESHALTTIAPAVDIYWIWMCYNTEFGIVYLCIFYKGISVHLLLYWIMMVVHYLLAIYKRLTYT